MNQTANKTRHVVPHTKVKLGLPNPPRWYRHLSPKSRSKARLKILASRSRPPLPSRSSKSAKQAKDYYRRHAPRKSGAQHPLFDYQFVYGKITTFNLFSDGHSEGIETNAPASVTFLDGWTSVTGNHKSPNNHRWSRVEGNYESGQRSSSNAGSSSVTSGPIGGTFPYFGPPIFDDSCYDQALSRLYDKIRGDIDLSIDIAESHKTKHMMSDTLKAMGSLAKTFRKMRRSNPIDWGNLWLEWTYGWKPLATSIYGAAHKLLLEPSRSRFVATASARSDEWSTLDAGDGVTGFRTQRLDRTRSSVRMKIDYQFSQSALDSLAGFTSLNPVSIAWELTPYSFVVDWFVDFGSYLRNFESACLYRTNFRQGYISFAAERTVRQTKTQDQFSATDTFHYNTSGDSLARTYQRSVLGASPLPRLPRFDPKLGTSRLISAAALLGQLLPGQRR